MNYLKMLSKRTLAFLLVFVMCVSMLDTAAFAVDSTDKNEDGSCTKSENCVAETHEADCPKYEVPEEAKDESNVTENETGESEGTSAALDVFNAAVEAMGDATDEESTLAALDTIETAYAALSDAEKAAVAEQWAYIQGYAEEVRAGNPDEGVDTMDVAEGSVAKVTKTDGSETGYPTLQAAINAAQDGDTVTLLKDVTEYVTIENKQNITLDLGGNTVIGESYGVVNIDNSTVTLKSGTAKAVSYYVAAGLEFWGANALIVTNSTLYLKDLKVVDDADERLAHFAVLTATGECEITVDNCDLNPRCAEMYLEENECTATIISGKISSANVKYFTLPEGSTYDEETETVSVGQPVNTAVAEVNGSGYTTLQAAIDAATEGQTVTLVKDVTESVAVAQGKTVTLDLNGKTLNGGTATGKAALTNKGTVTIMDSGTSGTIKREDNNTAGYYTVKNESVMYIRSGTITNNSNVSNLLINFNNQGGGNFGATEGVYMEISGGTISQTSMSALKNDPGCEMHITGDATVIERQSGNAGDWACNFYGKVVIDGGTITTSGIIPFMSHKNANGTEFPGEFTITGNAQLNCYGVYLANGMSGGKTPKTPKLSISGDAKITANQVYQVVNDNGLKVTPSAKIANIDIDGGTFAGACQNDATMKGYIVPTMGINSSGRVVELTADTGVAEVAGKYYNSLQAAVTAAEASDTVTLLANTTVTGTGVQINGKTITLDLNGKTITGNNIKSAYGAVNVNANSDVTIIGNGGGITADGVAVYLYSNSAATKGKLTVNGGTYKGNTAGCLYAEMGDITVLDGYFNCDDYNGKCFVLNKKDSNKASCTFIVYGGTFVGCNPAANNNENPEENQVASGYKSVEIEGSSNTWKVEINTAAAIAQIEDGQVYTTLQDAINAAGNGETVTLLQNVTTDAVTKVDNKTVTLDLGGHTLSRSGNAGSVLQMTDNGDLTIQNGTVNGNGSQVILVRNSKLTIKANATLTTANGTGIAVNALENKTSQVDVYGKVNAYFYGISGNANRSATDPSKNFVGACTINIHGGAKVTSAGTAALYLPNGNDTTNITGGTIKGVTGISIRGGALNVSGNPAITGDYTFGDIYYGFSYETQANRLGNGNCVYGPGIVAIPHSTGAAINVNISGGAVEGYYALCQHSANADWNGSVTWNVTSGTFTATAKEYTKDTNADRGGPYEGTENQAVYVPNGSKFISGGTYSSDVTEYCVEGKHAVMGTDSKWTIQDFIPMGTVTAYGGGKVEVNEDGKNVTVTFDSNNTLVYAADGNDYGRTPNKWWAGINVKAPEGAADAKYQKIGQWWNDDGNSTDWTTAAVVQADGQYWGMVTPVYMNQFKGDDNQLMYRYAFDWNGDGTNDQFVTIIVKGDVKYAEHEHVWDDGKVTKEATCAAEGEKTYTCAVCGETKTEPIAKLAHTAGEAVRENEVAATCTAEGSYDEVVYCAECQVEISREAHTIAALDHNTAGIVEHKDATCTETGVAGGTYCTRCDNGKAAAETVIPALGHSFATSWTSDGTNHWHICTREGCNVTDASAAHTFGEWTTDTPAQVGVAGTRHRECSVCAYRENGTIPALPTPEVPSGGGGGGAAAVTRYTLTINYVYADGTTAAPTHTELADRGSSYSVASPAVEGYAADQAVVSGTLTGNLTVTVTYAENTSIVDPDVPLAELPLPFTDVVAGTWFRESVAYVYANNLMNGVEETKFAPTDNTSRGMIVTILHRLDKEPSAAAEADFTDVLAGSWYKNAVDWGTSEGIINGYGDGRYGPNDLVTREQLVAILYRYAQMKGYDVSARADLSKFADADKISDYATEAMSWAVAAGLVDGTSDTTLSPRGNATRAQIATIMMRLSESVLPQNA